MCKSGKLIILAGLILLSGTWCAAQERATPSDKYFPLLLEHPGNRYLYDRFYDAWLDTRTLEQLESFLTENLDKRKDMAARLLLAFFYERQGRDTEALALYREAPEGHSADAEYLFYRARAEARNLNFEAAIADLVRARQLPCHDEIAEKTGKLLGQLYVRTDQKQKATELWKQLLAAGSENQELYEDLIELQIKEGLFEEALQSSDKLIAITKDPYKAVMHRLRQGDIYQYQADNDKALEVYSEALDMVGEESWLENQICAQIERIFDRDDNTHGLKDHLTSLVKAHPKRLGLKKRLANLLVQTGQADEALTMFQEILKVTPGDKANQKAYIRTLTDAGQLDKAITLLEQLFERDNQDRETLVELADLYHRNKENEKAGFVLSRSLDLSDKTEPAFLRIGGLLEQYQLRDEAKKVYRRMIAALPKSLSARLVYGEFLYRTDKKSEALRIFEAIAGQGDLQMMMRTSNAAGARGHYDLALRWVEGRYDEFSDDVTYLNHLCKIAIRLEKYDKAIVWARHQLGMAREYPMIRSALSQVITAVGTGVEAAQLIRELEAKDELTIQQMCLLSELLESQDRPARADAVLAEAAQINPNIATREQIHLYRLRRNWIGAAASMEALITGTGTREPNLIRELIELYRKCDRYEDALKWVLVWKKISPANTAPHICHSELLSAMGKDEDAVDVLDAAHREFAGNTEVLSQLARLYASTGQLEKAQATYWRLYETAQNVPERLRYIRDLSETAGQAGGRPKLVEKLKRQQQRNRSSAVPLLALAEVYKQMGRYEERRQALMEATRLQTEDIALLYELASLEEAQGQWQRAVETLQRAMGLDATSKTRLKMARLYIQHGDREEGFRILTEVAGGDKMDPRDAESIAGTMMSIGAWDTAIGFLQGLLSSHPKDYKLHYQYAVALEEDERTREAIEAFIDLLGFDEEIPGNQGKKIELRWARQGLDTDIQQILPTESAELLTLHQYRETAYRYRRNRARYGQSHINRPSSLPYSVALPPTVEDLQGFAISHILTLGIDLDPQGRSQVASDLRRYGIANADLVMALGESGSLPFGQTIEELANRHPDNETIQAIWIIQRIERQGCTLQEAQRIFNMFEKTHPRLALMVGLRCYGRDPIASRLFNRSLKMLKEVPDPGYYEITSIAYVLQNSQSGIRLTDAQKRFLDNHLIDWYAKLNKAVAGRIQIFNHVCSLLAERRDLSDYVRFLDAEVTGYSNAPLPTTAPFPPSYQPMIAPLPYPPREIPGFPAHVARKIIEGAGQRFVSRSRSRTPKASPTRLGTYLDKIENPTLKILIAMASGRKDDTKRLTTALLKDNPTSLAGYVMAASLAAVNGHPQKVVALLDKARSLPMSQKHHKILDGALVAGALELDRQKHPTEVEFGRRAAIRLISYKLDAAQQEELLVATETLGLAEQAKNLKKQILASAKRPAASPGGPMFAQARPFTATLIKKFFESGQTDSALRLALSHLKSEAHNALHFGYAINASSFAKDIVDLIQKHDAVGKFAELAAPSKKASVRQFVEYGRICELLRQKTGAVATYKKAIAQDPQNADARIQMALLSAQTNPGAGARHLAAINRSRVNSAGSELVKSIRHFLAMGQIEPALDIARMVTEYLALIKNPEKQNLDWVDQVADAIATESYSPKNQLNYLYQSHRPQATGGTRRRGANFYRPRRVFTGTGTTFGRRMQIMWDSLPKENARMAKIRRTVHNQLCHIMLDIPQLAEAAFARLAGEAQARDAVTHEFTDLARQAMLTHRPYPGAGALSAGGRNMSATRLVSPAEHLAVQAYKKGALDELANQFSQLKQNGATDQAEKLKYFAELYGASTDQFFGAADCFLANAMQPGTAGRQTFMNEDSACECVIDAYLTREMNGDQAMEQFILEKIEEDIAQGRFVHQHAAEYWLNKRMEKDRASAKAFLDSVLALYDSSQGQASGLSSRFRRYTLALTGNPTHMNFPQPIIRARPSGTTSIRIRTNSSRRSGTSSRRNRNTRSKNRTR